MISHIISISKHYTLNCLPTLQTRTNLSCNFLKTSCEMPLEFDANLQHRESYKFLAKARCYLNLNLLYKVDIYF